jgi:hypothetical protein
MGLRDVAFSDCGNILRDTAAFGTPITLTSPAGVVTSVNGNTNDVRFTIDPETGVAVVARRVSVAVHLSNLPELPAAVPDNGSPPWIVSFRQPSGDPLVPGRLWTFKVIEVQPDRTLGSVPLILEQFDAD